MLIEYSINSYELLERKLTNAEKEEVFNVFYKVGCRMDLIGLPHNYIEWLKMREQHLNKYLVRGNYTLDLYKQYKKHLGPLRFKLLIEGQKLVVPKKVNELLEMGHVSLLVPVLVLYKITRKVKLDWFLKSIILPKEYKKEIKELDVI
jgi:hypothetical protein